MDVSRRVTRQVSLESNTGSTGSRGASCKRSQPCEDTTRTPGQQAGPAARARQDPQQQQQPQPQPQPQHQRQQQHRRSGRVHQPAPLKLPPKEAQDHDYPNVEDNPAWSTTALAAAAAEGAAKLGVAVSASSSMPTQGSTLAASGPCSQAPGTTPAATGGNRRRCAAASAAASSSTTGAAVGVLMLAHERGVAVPQAWEDWEATHDGRMVVGVYLKAGVALTPDLPGGTWLATRLLAPRVLSKWGDISVTEALLAGAAALLQRHPQLQHVAVVSGQDVPAAMLPRARTLPAGLSLFGRFQFGAAFDGAAGRLAAQLLQQQEAGLGADDAAAWGAALTFHHTWLCLDRQLLLALLSKQEEILRVGAALNGRFMQPDAEVAADEFLLGTAALRYGFVRQVVHKRLPPYLAALHRQQHPGRQLLPAVQQQQQQQQQHMMPQEACGGAASSERDCSRHGGGHHTEQQQAGPVARLHDADPRRGPAAKKQQLTRQQAREGTHAGPPAPGMAMAEAVRSITSPTPSPSGGCDSAEAGGRGSGGRGSCTSAAGRPTTRRAAAAAAAGARGTDAARPTVTGSTSGSDDGASGSQQTAGRRSLSSGRQPTRAAAAASRAASKLQLQPARAGSSHSSSTTAAAVPGGGAGMTQGVLLDCCPTLALFDPSATRHPHEWRDFGCVLPVDVQDSTPGPHSMVLLQALGLAAPNGALFFRKIGSLQGAAQEQLLACLRLLWRRKQLPASVAQLPLTS